MAKRDIMLALNQTPDGSLPKNPFDLGHYQYSTSKLGQLSVVDCIETVPDADYEVGVDGYTFTIPCNTASIAKMKENFYFLYVPFSQLVSNSYAFFVQRKDNQSAIDYSNEKIPFFNLGDVVLRCIEIASDPDQWPAFKDIHGFNIGASALRLLDLLGYGCYLDLLEAYKQGDLTYESLANFCNIHLNNKKPNILRIAAYQKCWYCYFRNPLYDEMAGSDPSVDVNPRCFNFDDVVQHSAGVTDNYNVMAHRDIDNFIRECLQMRYVGYKKDLLTAFMPGTQYGAVSFVPLSSDAVVSGVVQISGQTDDDRGEWKSFGVVTQETFDISNVREMRSRDIPTRVYENGEWTFTQEPYGVRAVGQSVNDGDIDYEEFGITHSHSFSGSGSLSSGRISAGSSLFNVLQLVEAQAMQKWKQKSMLAGQRGINQYRAHYGVVPRHMEDHYPDFIGSVDNQIVIDRVINSANTAPDVTEETNLGDLGGRAYGASNPRTFHCHSTEHGVIMVLRSVVPENCYSSYGLDRANQLINYADFWQPEFQNIGLEFIPKCISDASSAVADPNGHYDDSEDWGTKSSAGFGFAPRNYQLKTKLSKVHGMFNPNRSGYKMSWEGQSSFMPYGFVDMQSFVMTRQDLNNIITIDKNSHSITTVSGLYLVKGLFYVDPSLANSVFIVDADDYELTDPFIHRHYVICNAVQPLTVLGLPQF